MKRREFLATAAAGAAMMAASSRGEEAPAQAVPQGKAEHCIFVWLGGGAAQIDTWDPKEKGTGREEGRLVLCCDRYGNFRDAGLRAPAAMRQTPRPIQPRPLGASRGDR
jgi:hypothetical protein